MKQVNESQNSLINNLLMQLYAVGHCCAQRLQIDPNLAAGLAISSQLVAP